MEQQGASLDLPLITEATNEFYRQVYGNSDLAPIFKGYNMVVLRRHVCYFILQLSAFDTPISEPQIEYLRKVHAPVIEERGATQRHFDIVASLLVTSFRAAGAQGSALLLMQSKLRPLRDIFPLHAAASASGSQAGSSLNSVDGAIMLQERGREQAAQQAKQQQQQQQSPQQRRQQRKRRGVAVVTC
ncbi:hypothetical protein OEZ86_011343 [Tetradesmus obliquus]|nr:hypothetical protein OEZ86_011343 [Tetradesmus obliquus]